MKKTTPGITGDGNKMSTGRHDNPLRILVVGASESNRRRHPSLGLEANQVWAEEVERRNLVRGYWPAYLMNGLEAGIQGRPFPDQTVLGEFGKGRYLWDRRFIYRWRSVELWNIAMPATIARFGLYYLNAHREKFRAFAPDVIILCLGSVDCLEISIKRSGADITEIGDTDRLLPDASLTFDYCRSADDFYDVMTQVAETISWISRGRTVLHLDILSGNLKSRFQKERAHAFSDVVRKISLQFNHTYITYPFLEKCVGDEMDTWFRPDDGHPTDAMNARIATMLLENIPLRPLSENRIDDTPMPVIRVADWTREICR